MKQLKIDFLNMWGGFFKHDNIITNTLSLEYNVTVDENNPDIIVCQSSPSDHQSPSAASLTDGVKGRAKIVHWLVESIDRTGDPDYSSCDFSFSSCGFDDSRNVRIPLWAMYVDWFGNQYVQGRNQAFLVSPELLLNPPDYTEKKKFCCVLTNNDMALRAEVYPKFIGFGVENGLLVESRGRAFTNMPSIGGDEKDKLEYIDNFKFNLCFDNGEADGWVTEKLIHPLSKGVIPIYWGCPNVGEEFNEEAFIHARRFNNTDELNQAVLSIYNKPELFQEIQNQPCFPDNKIPDCANPEFLLEEFKKVLGL